MIWKLNILCLTGHPVHKTALDEEGDADRQKDKQKIERRKKKQKNNYTYTKRDIYAYSNKELEQRRGARNMKEITVDLDYRQTT